MITIDISKAKDVWKDKIRFHRAKALKKLDLDFIFSSVFLITTIISYTSPKTKKITSLFYIRLSRTGR